MQGVPVRLVRSHTSRRPGGLALAAVDRVEAAGHGGGWLLGEVETRGHLPVP
jgi:hypothetical protein